MEKDESVIPKGPYCYTLVGKGNFQICPYWRKIKDRSEQYDGWCDFLEYGDLEHEKEMILKDMKTGEESKGDELPFPVSLLFDQCKECHINDDYDEED